MKLLSLCLLTTLALLYAGLTMAETMTYRKWERAMADQRDVQAKVAYFQNMDQILQRMVRSIAYNSQHDPALGQLLKARNIKVVVTNSLPGNETMGADASTNAVPLPNLSLPPSSNPAPVPPGTTPVHP
jgi:hypothetical protein